MVQSFDVERFEFSVVLFLLLSGNVGSAFTEAQPGSSLTALCFEIVTTEKNCGAGISNRVSKGRPATNKNV